MIWFALAMVLLGCDQAGDTSSPGKQNPASPAAKAPSPSAPTVVESDVNLDSAINLYDAGNVNQALAVCRQLLESQGDHAEVLSLLIQIYSDKGEIANAARFAERLAEVEAGTNSMVVLVRAYYWYIESGDFEAAERVLRNAIEKHPQEVPPHRLLAGLLCAQGRRHEAAVPLKALIRLQNIRPAELLGLIDLGSTYQLVSFAPYENKNEVSLLSLGRARHQYVADHQAKSALALIEKVVDRFPDSLSARTLQGRILIESGKMTEYAQWLGNQPEVIKDTSEYWAAMGLWYQLQDKHSVAIRCFSEAFLRDATDRQSLRGVISSLETTGQAKRATAVRENLSSLDWIYRNAKDSDAETCREIAARLQRLQRPFESNAWLMNASSMEGTLEQQKPQFRKRLEQIEKWVAANTEEGVRNLRVEKTLGFRLQQFPLPDPNLSHVAASQADDESSRAEFRFVDIAPSAGLKSRPKYCIAANANHIPYLYETTGNGVAVLDFDLDGRADIYLVQGLHQPPGEDPVSANQLFRQVDALGQQSEEAFSDVSQSSATDDPGYGQGTGVADVNQDGFPDLLVANFGTSRVFENQGDGTFREKQVAWQGDSNWTTSIAAGDLDGDHLPELIQVNYVDDPQAPTKACDLGSNCTPQQLGAAEDYFYRCLPTGLYQRIKFTETGTKRNYGLGLIVADFDLDQQNDVFISNDGDVNHYWSRIPTTSGNESQDLLVESARIRGCSVGRNGRSQACMGIAAGDFNRDGLLDLHVTNFVNEPSNLFLQTTPGTFADEALKYGLFDSSMRTLGFGTQARDFDNDGWLDLAILNGHVFGDLDEQTPFRMRPQLMSGRGSQFQTISGESVGDYFTKDALGRGLAALDWNRDGKMDLVASHLDRSLALLENQSPRTGSWVQFSLVGTASERDAIGATVSVTVGDETFHQFRVSGDGYLSCNESVMHFGIGDAVQADSVTVHWPSGAVETFEGVPLDRRYLMVEGGGSLVEFAF